MIRLFLFLNMFTIFLLAADKEACYTVQLLSKHNSSKNYNLTIKKRYPNDCQVMTIGKTLTVRCGCFERLKEAKGRLKKLKPHYKLAVVSRTYKYRFKNLSSKETPNEEEDEKTDVQKAIEENFKKNQNKPNLKPKKTKKELCYSVQIKSTPKSQKNLDLLNKKIYPPSCKVMEFKRTFGVRCGCYEKIADAKLELKKLKKSYKNSLLLETYKYRFDANYRVPVKYLREENRKISAKEQELRLMTQVFLYKGDLENAYKVASIGYSQHPNSYYWNEKMANICQWTNRSARSMKHLRKMYELRYDPVIEEKLINYGASAYQYENIEPLVLNRAMRNPTEENIDLLILIYKKIGEPEKVVKILDKEYKRTGNKLLISKALGLALEIGDLELAKKYVDMIEKSKPYSKVDAALLARYYYIHKEIEKAYESLEYAQNSNTIKDVNDTNELKFFELKSDLGWYLQKEKAAAKASKKLVDIHKARLADYERVSMVYPDINATVAINAVREGYLKYKQSYMFLSYANDAIAKKKFRDLEELLKTVDESTSPLVNEPLYWIVKASVYRYEKKYTLEEKALKKALALAPDNKQIRISLLWHFMEMDNYLNVQTILLNIEESGEIDSVFYYPLASGYFYLHNINRASYYVSKAISSGNQVVNTLPFKFLQAYIYQIQNNEYAFKSKMIEIVDMLKAQAKKHPLLKKQDKFLSNYLRAAMYVLRADKFEKRLKQAKPYLSRKNYEEISYSWAMQIKAYEKSHKIFHHMKQKEIWVRFSDALTFQRHSNIEDMIDLYLKTLSPGDATKGAEGDGQIALAQSKAYEIYDKNNFNQNAYIQHLDLSKRRSERLGIKTSYYDRDPLLQRYAAIKNRIYLNDGWYSYQGFNYYTNGSKDNNILVYVPNFIYDAMLGIERVDDRLRVRFDIGYHNGLANYFRYRLDSIYRVSANVYIGMELADNKRAEESTQLYLAGKKDIISPRLKYQILPSTSLDFMYEDAKYYSDDDVYLGRGDYFRASLNRQIRNGYPDLLLGAFYDAGNYDEMSGSKGVIDRLQNQNFQVLPNKFYNIGMSFAYGMANSTLYTRVWRPYFEVSTYYNSDIDDYSYGFNAGLGGMVFHQDHLVFGMNYTESVNGVGGSIFELFMHYRFMYHLPR